MGRTKATIDVDGVAMARRVADALSAAGCSRVFAYGGDPVELAPLKVEVIVDSRQGEGPLGAVLGILEMFESVETARGSGPRWVLVVACDLPFLTGADLRGLVEKGHEVHEDVQVVVARSTRLEPACALWRVSSLDPIRAMYDRGERALHAAIGQLRAVEIDVDPRALTNINTPGDLHGYP